MIGITDRPRHRRRLHRDGIDRLRRRLEDGTDRLRLLRDRALNHDQDPDQDQEDPDRDLGQHHPEDRDQAQDQEAPDQDRPDVKRRAKRYEKVRF